MKEWFSNLKFRLFGETRIIFWFVLGAILISALTYIGVWTLIISLAIKLGK